MKEKYQIQRDCYDNNKEYVDKEKTRYWFNQLKFPSIISISKHLGVYYLASMAKVPILNRPLNSHCTSSVSRVLAIRRKIISYSSIRSLLMMNARRWPKPSLTSSSSTKTARSRVQCSHKTQVLRLGYLKN